MVGSRSETYAERSHGAVHIDVAETDSLPPFLIHHLADGVDARGLAELLQIAAAVGFGDLRKVRNDVHVAEHFVTQNHA